MPPRENMIDINLHNNFDELDENEWDALLQKSITNAPFLQYGYLERWWTHKGGGEWNTGNLVLLSARMNDELIGIAPLFSAVQEGKKKLLFLGSIEISDYLDFIYDPQHGQEFFNAVFDYLVNNDFSDIESLLLYNLPESSPTNTYLKKTCDEKGWKLESAHAYHTPSIQLAADWDTYLAGIDKKQRHEIRRKLRRAEGSPETIDWYSVDERSSLDDEIEDFFKLMVLDEEKQEFLTDPMREQMRSIIHWAFDEKILQLSFMTVEGAKVAAYLCFDYQQRIWVYNSGFDPQYREYSPGWVMLSYLIQDAISNGKQIFDFMRGDEDYKYRFGATDSFILKTEISR